MIVYTNLHELILNKLYKCIHYFQYCLLEINNSFGCDL